MAVELVRRTRPVALGAAAMLLLAACAGVATPPTGISSTSATLNARASCSADDSANPCLAWFQWWADGPNPTILSSRSTPIGPVGSAVSNVAISQSISGLTPGQLYHAQLCGQGDSNVSSSQPVCIGPFGGQLNAPGTTPADMGDLNATQSFRTATATTTATVDIGRVLSTGDTASMPISRDGGLSAAYAPGKALWVFGDTVQRNGPFFIATGTAAAGPFTVGQAPQALDELPTPPAAPSPGRASPAGFFPPPTGLLTPGSTSVACGTDGASYSADWLSGAATIPGTSTVLLTYGEMCIDTGFIWPEERMVLIEYDAIGNRFTAKHTPLVASPLGAGLPAVQRLGSPVFGSDGFLYLFTSDSGGVHVARVPSGNRARWDQAASFQWWSQPSGQPVGWYGVAQSGSAVSILPAGTAPLLISVADYSATTSKRLAMVAQTGLGAATFQVYTASSPTGPWTAGPSAQVPDACPVGMFGCYALSGHPELSTSQQLVFSWYSTDDRDNFGHVRVGAMAW